MPTRWMTSTQIAKRTGFSARYIREEIRSGRLPGQLFGTRGGHGTYRVPWAAAEVYIGQVTGQTQPTCCGQCGARCPRWKSST